jgi:hypothetical protein
MAAVRAERAAGYPPPLAGEVPSSSEAKARRKGETSARSPFRLPRTFVLGSHLPRKRGRRASSQIFKASAAPHLRVLLSSFSPSFASVEG